MCIRDSKKTTWPWESDPKVKGFKKFRELWGSTLVVPVSYTHLTLDGKPVAEAAGKPVGFLEGRDGQGMKVEEDQFLPGFASALEGLKAGDSKDITVTIPDTFPMCSPYLPINF